MLFKPLKILRPSIILHTRQISEEMYIIPCQSPHLVASYLVNKNEELISKELKGFLAKGIVLLLHLCSSMEE